MARVAASEFSKEIIRICSESKIVSIWDVKIHEDVVTKIRIFLVDKSFIEVYYNFETGKTSFAWIRNNKRVYGADNLEYWHFHPIEKPEEHIKSNEISFTQFLLNVEKYH
ncbi:MAG: hypothetical protein AABX14_03765 [Candidatus Aenigmatarchaeota archaeon]|mgnify:CR=1 FL=1